ncbi:AAA family ATPase [Jeotgalibaca caeni]|uniref:AAA family ATPase n=1 Tax=Jeotgalibaca caeni TaxID=3028623 RepID=UPI00237DA0FD|nr:AAA family ATPase [Jeotgalibaca caeni]MDE1549806.1 AAA family ATPase [Jeotgalibaca caeni]
MEIIPEEKVEDRLRGMEYNIKNNMALSSLPALREVYETHPDHPQVNYLMALNYYKNHDYHKAMAFVQKAVENNPTAANYQVLLAQLYLRQRLPQDAEEHAQKAYALQEDNWEAAKILAELSFNRNQLEKALELTEVVLEHQPKTYASHRLKTKIYLQQEEALDKILESIATSEKYGYDDDIEYDRVYAYYIHGDFEECRKIFSHLKRTRPLSHSTAKVASLVDSMQVKKGGRSVGPNPFGMDAIQPYKKTKKTLEESLGELDRLIGLEEVKSTINRIVKLAEYNKRRSYILSIEKGEEPSYHFAFSGNPGTGKTTVARILADIFYSLGILKTGQLIEVDRSDLVGGYMGQTAQKTREVIDSAIGGVLFIDEAYSLSPGKGEQSDYGSEAIEILIKAMEDQRSDFIVILAGYDAGMKSLLKSNPGLSSRINMQVNFDDFSDSELLEIAKGQAEDNHYTLTEEAEKAFLVKINQEKVSPQFANARAVRNIMESAMRERAYRLSDRSLTEEDLVILEPYDFGIDPKQLFGNDIKDLMGQLDSLVGLHDVKAQVKSILNYVRAEKRREELGHAINDLSLHMVFNGNPGTGKTTIARLISKILKSIGVLKRGHMIEVTRDDLVGQYVGQTGPKTLEKIKEAYGGVLFIDEAYSLYSGSDNDFGYEAISTLIKEMEDNRDKLVVIMAGYPHEMEKMLSMNSGIRSRMSYTVDFPNYSSEELLEIFLMGAKQQGFILTEEAKQTVQAVFETAYQKRDRHFGNARSARSLFEKAKLQQSNRLALDEEADLFTILAEDILKA